MTFDWTTFLLELLNIGILPGARLISAVWSSRQNPVAGTEAMSIRH